MQWKCNIISRLIKFSENRFVTAAWLDCAVVTNYNSVHYGTKHMVHDSRVLIHAVIDSWPRSTHRI